MGVKVGVFDGVGVLDGVKLGVLDGVLVNVGVSVAGWKGVKETVGVALSVGVGVAVNVGVMVSVAITAVRLRIGVGDGMVSVMRGVGVVRVSGANERAINPAQ